jgi:hypothetical protein
MGALTPGPPALRPTAGVNTCFGEVQVSLRLVIEPSDHSVSNHLLSPRRLSGFRASGLPYHGFVVAPFRGPVRHLGFASQEQARHDSRPNRVDLRYGLIVHLRLLSTPPRGDAVTVSYEVPEHFGKDFHLADSMQLQAHSWTLRVLFAGLRGLRFERRRTRTTRSVEDGIPTEDRGNE